MMDVHPRSSIHYICEIGGMLDLWFGLAFFTVGVHFSRKAFKLVHRFVSYGLEKAAKMRALALWNRQTFPIGEKLLLIAMAILSTAGCVYQFYELIALFSEHETITAFSFKAAAPLDRLVLPSITLCSGDLMDSKVRLQIHNETRIKWQSGEISSSLCKHQSRELICDPE